MVLQLSVADVVTRQVFSVTPDNLLQQAVQLISDHHISDLPVVDDAGVQIGELSEQELMVRESGVDAGRYAMLLDSVIYVRNPPQLGQTGAPGARHQSEGSDAEVRPHLKPGTGLSQSSLTAA